MRELVWSPAFSRQFKRLIRQNPQIREVAKETLQKLNDDIFDPTLRTHKLRGELEENGHVQLTIAIVSFLNLLRIMI